MAEWEGFEPSDGFLTVTRFPVVLVMTASIPLHDIGWPCQTPDSPNIIHKSCPFVKGYF